MLFRTIVNSTKLLFLYLLIQLPSPKIKIPQNSNFKEELSSNLGGVRFGIDAEGNYGYKKAGADTVTPFRNVKSQTVTQTLKTNYQQTITFNNLEEIIGISYITSNGMDIIYHLSGHSGPYFSINGNEITFMISDGGPAHNYATMTVTAIGY